MIEIILITLIITVFVTLLTLCLIMRVNDIVLAKTIDNRCFVGYFVLVNKNCLFEHKEMFQPLNDNELYKDINVVNLFQFLYSEYLSINLFK